MQNIISALSYINNAVAVVTFFNHIKILLFSIN